MASSFGSAPTATCLFVFVNVVATNRVLLVYMLTASSKPVAFQIAVCLDADTRLTRATLTSLTLTTATPSTTANENAQHLRSAPEAQLRLEWVYG